jgi:PQQ-dependent catabolism-associated CXXCW motif protein
MIRIVALMICMALAAPAADTIALAAPAAAVTLATQAAGPDWQARRDARPDLFHPATGMRIAHPRAPTPTDIPAPARVVDAPEARAMLAAGAVAIDVYSAPNSRHDELDGTWPGAAPRLTLPGAVWLPEVGRGTLSDQMARWYAAELARLTDGDTARPLVIFCVADCWMSWNAARRAAEDLGYSAVAWFRLGTDGWLDQGWPLAPASPRPVDVD